MRAPCVTTMALRGWPLFYAAGADPASVEGVPFVAALTSPQVACRRTPIAFWATDFGAVNARSLPLALADLHIFKRNRCDCHNNSDSSTWRPGPRSSARRAYEIALAIVNAAIDASPPMAAACSALRSGLAPVNLPLTYPNTSKASNVTTAEIFSASLTLVTKK